MEEPDFAETRIATVRRNIRELEFQERKEHREKQVNSRRGILGEVLDLERIYTPQEVKSLAGKLKNKSHFTAADYICLSQAAIQNEENIVTFFKVPGALQCLVRDLTGMNASLQLVAANCCCNLALGNNKSCMLLTTAAAPYLLLNLDGLNNHLVEISAWTLGNLAGSHEKSWSVLETQGLLPKLLNLITSSDTKVVQSAVYALTHYVRILICSGNLKSDSLVTIATHVHPIMEIEQTSLWLLYLLSCFNECEDVLLRGFVISRSVNLLSQYASRSELDTNILRSTALVRILANLCAGQGANELLNMDPTIVISVLKTLLSSQYKHLNNETLWLVGNFFNHNSEEIRSSVISSKLELKLEPILSETLLKIS